MNIDGRGHLNWNSGNSCGDGVLASGGCLVPGTEVWPSRVLRTWLSGDNNRHPELRDVLSGNTAVRKVGRADSVEISCGLPPTRRAVIAGQPAGIHLRQVTTDLMFQALSDRAS